MNCDEVVAHLDDIESAVRSAAPFDVSPRGVSFRPESDLKVMIEQLSDCADEAVAALSNRLEVTSSQFLSLTWLQCLKAVGTQKAEEAIHKFVERMLRERLWVDEFPGPREILLFVGW